MPGSEGSTQKMEGLKGVLLTIMAPMLTHLAPPASAGDIYSECILICLFRHTNPLHPLSAPSPPPPRSSAPETCPSILRCHLVLLCTMAAVTQNLPPVQTCDFRLWHTPAAMLNIFTRHEVAAKDLISRLGDCACECTVMWGTTLTHPASTLLASSLRSHRHHQLLQFSFNFY